MKHNWEYKRLGSFLKTTSGGTPLKGVSEYYDNGTIPWLRSGEVCKKEILDCEIYITQKAVDESSAKFIPANSVVMAMYGATAGQVGIIRQVMTTNQAICSIFPSPFYSQDFLYYFLSSLKDKLVEQAYGAAQPNISQTIIKSLYIPVPQMKTQDQIVAELDQINDLIAKNRELLSQLDALAQSLFYDTFGDPSVNPKSFPLCALSDICDVISTGITYKPEMVAEDGTIVLRSSNIQESKFVLDDIVRVQMQLKETQYVKKNDILMCSRNGSARLVGKACLIPELSERMSWGAFMTIIRSKYFHYLFHYFRLPAFREQLKKTKTSTVNQITIGMLKGIKLPFPPLALQEDFAAKVEAIEAQKAKIEAEIAELQTLLDARMDYWFN